MEKSTEIGGNMEERTGNPSWGDRGKVTMQTNKEETDRPGEQKTLETKGLRSSLDSASYSIQEFLVQPRYVTSNFWPESQKETRFNGKNMYSEARPSWDL